MLKLPEDAKKAAEKKIGDAIRLLDEKQDIRIVLRQTDQIEPKIRAACEISDTPENRFVSVLCAALQGWTERAYERKPEEWYQLNKSNIEKFSPILRSYLLSLKDAVEMNDFEKAINAFKDYWFALYNHTRLLSE